METNTVQEQQEIEGYTLKDLERLERQFKLRHAINAAYPQASNDKAPNAGSSVLTDRTDRPSETRELRATVSDVEKLKAVRLRREKYLSNRTAVREDFLISLVSVDGPFVHIGRAESKGRSYWFRRTQDDYIENWFLKYSPVRRYYEQFTLDTLVEPDTRKLGARFIELTTSEMDAVKGGKRLVG